MKTDTDQRLFFFNTTQLELAVCYLFFVAVDHDNNGIVHTTVADIVRDDERKTLCASQDYCLNHGTCYVLNSLGRKFCR